MITLEDFHYESRRIYHDPERCSNAENSWRIALMAMLLKEFTDANIDKVTRMCLIHGFGEAFTGDILTFVKKDNDRDVEEDLFLGWVKTFPEKVGTHGWHC